MRQKRSLSARIESIASSIRRKHRVLLLYVGVAASLGHVPFANAQDADAGTGAAPVDHAAPTQDPVPEPEASPTPAESAPIVTEHPLEVKVRGNQNEAQRLQQSAEAVNVVETRTAKHETADLGEVLARTQGVTVRRDGGLGSNTRFSLNGLYDDQIRIFLDSVPLELAGYPFGIANVPVNLIDRIEVYRGVVPIRFGADALGGAVNLVTNQKYETRLAASYQVGSFGTYRLAVDGRYRHEPTGLVAGVSAFFDGTENNYDIDVMNPTGGRLQPVSVPRFHDAYRAFGTTFEAGIVDRPWAKRLLLKGFVSSYDKELQHNVVMTVPYGEVTYGESVYGMTGRYEVALSRTVDLEVLGSYAHRDIDFVDKGTWVYDWTGRRGRARAAAGEVGGGPSDQTVVQHGAFARPLLKWAIAPEHIVRISTTPQFTTRTGDERIQADPNARDPLTARRELFTLVSGVEYELNAVGERLSNIVFLKDYVYRADSEDPAPNGVFHPRETNEHSQGIGDALRYRFLPWLYAKASYEYATRLPRPDEVFGNGVLIKANLELEPEVSHNANLGPRVELKGTPIGAFTLDVNAFLRESDRLIVLNGNDRSFTYQNLNKARGLGLDNALSWMSPKRWVSVDGMLTWQDIRNTSTEGAFANFEGDRVPNRPYLFGSWGARLRVPNMPARSDAIEPFYHGRYTHEFYRAWESQGLRQFKQVVDAQVTHDVGVSWTVSRDIARITSTWEIDNLTDAKVFDNFGVQRPGRAIYLKVSGEL